MSFRLERPAHRARHVVVEVPHASVRVPRSLRAAVRVAPLDLARDADLFVDRLFAGAPSRGAPLLTAVWSRYVVDLNRTEDDVDAASVVGAAARPGGSPRGVIWRETTNGVPVFDEPMSADALETRLERYYRPYHSTLESLVLETKRADGAAVLVAAHSMPSTGRAGHSDPRRRRADIVPGTRARTTAAGVVIDTVERHFRAAGLSVEHDVPYRGGATVARWGRPADAMHAVQIEINRGLYMDESTCTPSARFEWMSELCTSLVERLADIGPAELR